MPNDDYRDWMTEEMRLRYERLDQCVELWKDGLSAGQIVQRFPEFKVATIYSYCHRARVKRTLTAREVYIYALRCPVSKQYFYVGCSSNPWTRYYAHVSRPGSDHLRQWMKCLKKQGLKPELAILDYQCTAEPRALERNWILRIEADGHPLMNMQNREDSVW